MSATVQELVEHALASSTADDCVVIAHHGTSANLRWANNTLTTNGVMRGIDVTVVAFARKSGGVSVGSVSGSAASLEQVDALVGSRRCRGPRRRPGGRRQRSRGRHGRRRVGATPRARPTSTSSTPSPRPWARRSAAPGRVVGSSTGSSTTT